jgi:hypothetical protein
LGASACRICRSWKLAIFSLMCLTHVASLHRSHRSGIWHANGHALSGHARIFPGCTLAMYHRSSMCPWPWSNVQGIAFSKPSAVVPLTGQWSNRTSP